MRKPQLAWAMLLAALCSSPVLAQSAAGQFLCEAEVGAGIFFDQETRHWQSNGFVPDGKFVATIKTTPAPSDAKNGLELYHYYVVEIAEFGSQALPCVTGGDFLFGSVKTLSVAPVINCDTLFYSYRVNPRTLRFLRVYLNGYIDGRDEPGNTPAVMAGQCARLN